MLEIPKREIVVGDIVMLNAGDEIPADGILLSAVSVQVNESSLTGEPMATKTTIEADFDIFLMFYHNNESRRQTECHILPRFSQNPNNDRYHRCTRD